MGTDSSLQSDNFLEMFASLALSKASEGITTFSVIRFLSEMQAAGESRSPVSIFSPSPAQITSHIRPIPKSKFLPFQGWAWTFFIWKQKSKCWPFTGVNQHRSFSKPTSLRLWPLNDHFILCFELSSTYSIEKWKCHLLSRDWNVFICQISSCSSRNTTTVVTHTTLIFFEQRFVKLHVALYQSFLEPWSLKVCEHQSLFDLETRLIILRQRVMGDKSTSPTISGIQKVQDYGAKPLHKRCHVKHIYSVVN